MASALIGALRVTLGLDSAAFEEGMKNLRGSLNKAGKQMQNVGRQMSTYVTAPVVAFGGITLKVAGDFEKAMNQVQAVSGATGDQFQALREQAKRLGATTQYTAAQAADAMGFLAMAGMEANDILSAMPDTLQLAAAAQLDMASAADIVTNILAGYNKDVSELGHTTDVLVKAFTSANTDLRQLAEAMKYAGPVASAAGVQFEEAAAALSLMGNAGIQASMAGTSLRGAVSRVLNPTKAMRTAMEEAGLAFTDASGKLLPLADIIQQLEPHADNAGLFMELFGQRAGPAMAALVSQGSDAVRELTSELENSAGTAAEIAAVQMEGFNGAMRELTSAFEGLQLAIADSGLIEWATEAVKAVTQWVQTISKTNPELLKWGTIIAGVGAAIGPVVLALGLLATGLAAISAPVLAVTAGIAALTAGVIAFWPEIDAAGKAVNAFLASIGEGLRAAIDGAVQKFFELDAKLREFSDQIIEIFRAIPGQMLEIGRSIISGLWNGIKGQWEVFKSDVSGLASGITGTFKSVLGIHSPSKVMHEIGQNIMQGLANGMQSMAGSVTGGAGTIANDLQSAFQGIGSSIADALKGTKEWRDVLRDMLSQIARLALSGLGQMGGFGGFLSSIFGSLMGFANGGSFTVGGAGGVDSQLIAFRATPGEMVDIRKPGQDRGGGSIIINAPINAPGADPAQLKRVEESVKELGRNIPKMVDQRVNTKQLRGTRA